MSRTTSTKRKGGESLPDPPAKKSKTNSAAENKPVKKAKVATSTATATALDTAAPTPPLKSKQTRKTAADFLDDFISDGDNASKAVISKPHTRKSKKDVDLLVEAIAIETKLAKQSKNTDDDAVESVVDKTKDTKKSKKSKKDVAASDAAVDQPKAATKSKDNIDAQTTATSQPKASKKSKNDNAGAADAVVDNSKIAKKTKANNNDDLAASRQLRVENGEPVTPAAPAVAAAKKLDQAEKRAQAKAAREKAKIHALLESRGRPVIERPSKLKTLNDDQNTAIAKKKSGKMNSDALTTDIADEVKPTKKGADKIKKANEVAADDQDLSNKKMADKAKDPTTTDDTSAVDEADLLMGFDSDTPGDAQDEGLDIRETPPITDPTGKIEKQLREANRKAGPDDEPGTIYIGHIPHGFFEVQMRAFFSQFGDITRIRLSRNRRTGASKHFAFVEFASDEVAKIAAKTMDGYLMFGQILKSKFAPADSLHPDLWKGANKKFHKIPHAKLEGQKLAEPKSVEQWDKKAAKEEARRKKKGKAIKEKMGYEVPAAGVAAAKAPKKEKKEL